VCGVEESEGKGKEDVLRGEGGCVGRGRRMCWEGKEDVLGGEGGCVGRGRREKR